MTPDVIVIGAGLMGSSIALELQRVGRDVVVVDKGDAVGGGSTSASSSVVRFTYSTRDGVIAAWESMHRWDDWPDHLGGVVDGPLATFHRIGMLSIDPPGADNTAVIAHFEAVGVPYEELDADGIAARYPALDVGRFHPPGLPTDPRFYDDAHGRVSGLVNPDAGFIDDPQLAAANLMDAARHHGTRLRLRTRVTGVRRDGNRVRGVLLEGGDQLGAPVVINAAGPWSSRLNSIAGVLDDMRITTRALRQDVASTTAPLDFGVTTGGAVMADLDLGTYCRPQPGGSFLVGGVEAECDPLEWVDDPDSISPHPGAAMFDALAQRAARRLPGLGVPPRPMGVAGCYDVTDDWVPIYDRSSLDGFYMAVGTSGNQFKNAPVVGQIMRDIIEACEAGHDHDADPVQVDCHRTGLMLDTGHYSRRRAPATTSGTVLG